MSNIVFPENIGVTNYGTVRLGGNFIADGNDKGSWYSWQIEKVGLIDTLDMYNECKEFHNNVSTGAVKSSAIADDLPPASMGTDEVPF